MALIFLTRLVVQCQRYVKSTGIGMPLSMTLPFSVTILLLWTIFLLYYWGLGLPMAYKPVMSILRDNCPA